MYYPVTDYIALALIISFLFLTLFICLLCLKHERIKKKLSGKKMHIFWIMAGMQLSSHGSDTDSITKRVFTSRSRRPLSLQSPFLVGALKKNTALSPTCWSLTP